VYATSPGIDDPAPAATSPRPATRAIPAGTRNVCETARHDARRQAISGPIPIRSSNGNPNTRRKKS